MAKASGNYILFVGNLEPRKNLTSLIQAYTALPKSITDKYALLIVGAKGWLNNEIFDSILRARLEGYRILRPEGYVEDEDTPPIYSGASLLAYPSHYEGFGLPILEAMACGVPVIAGNNSSMPEVGGSAAKYVDSESIKEITTMMETVLKDKKLRETMTRKGFERTNEYSWEKSAQDLLDIYDEMVER